MATKFKDRGALERFFMLEDIYTSAERMVAEASVFGVDEVIAGIEDWCADQGVPTMLGDGYDTFIDGLKAKAQAKKDVNTANVRHVMDMLAVLAATEGTATE